jgi:ribonuclease P protein component
VAQTFPRSCRLTHDLEFQGVYGARVKKTRGPLTVFAKPSDRPNHRLGLSIRKFTTAVARNRLKRLLREAFRLVQDDLPRPSAGSYDLVVTARDHNPLTLGEYQQVLLDLVGQTHREWERRHAREAGA